MSRDRFSVLYVPKYVFVVVLLVIMNCAAVAQSSPENIVITETQANQTVSAHTGEIVTIKLTMQSGTGYSWQFSSSKPKIVALEGQPEIVADNDTKLGRVETQVFHVRILRSGKAKLSFKYIRPWEKDVAPQKTFRVTVHASGKIVKPE